MFKNADAKISTTTLSRSGEGVAVLLNLPEAELAQFRNKSYYYSSFELSQRDIFEAIKRATGTRDADWDISEKDAPEIIAPTESKIREGDGYAEWYRLFSMYFQGIQGSNYEDKAIDLEKYGLPKENFDVVIKQAIAEM